jgi:outer membrane protein OmpA-like peptidoglycan-associated protein
MTDPARSIAEARSTVLVVLSGEQRVAWGPELGSLERPELELTFEEDPEVALSLIKRTCPSLVLVGMSVGAMEGLEFLAMLFQSLPDFPGRVVVLPDKGDPFRPMLQGRDPVTKRSTTTPIDFEGIERLVDLLVRAERSAPQNVAAPEPAIPVEPLPAIPPEPQPKGRDAPTESRGSMPDSMPSRPKGRGALMVLLPCAVVLLIGAVTLVVRALVTHEGRAGVSSGPTAPRLEPAPAVAATSVASQEAPATHEAPASAKDAAVPTYPALDQLTTLPLSFARGSAEFEVTSGPDLDRLVDEIKAGLGSGVLEIGGHTSREGTEQLNRELSQRRAASVQRYMVSRGVPEARTVLKAYHVSAAAPSASPAANRRVTVRVLR